MLHNTATPWSVFTLNGKNVVSEHTFRTRKNARDFSAQARRIEGVTTTIKRRNSKVASRLRMKIVATSSIRIVVDNSHKTAPRIKGKKPQVWHKLAINEVPPLLALMQA